MAQSTNGTATVRHVGGWIIFLTATALVVASAIVLTVLLGSNPYYWPLTLIGAAILVALLSAAALPHLRPDR